MHHGDMMENRICGQICNIKYLLFLNKDRHNWSYFTMPCAGLGQYTYKYALNILYSQYLYSGDTICNTLIMPPSPHLSQVRSTVP